MSLYSIEHIIRELFEEREARNNTPHPAAWKADLGPCVTVKWKLGGAQNEIYWQTWMALNLWIESQLAKKLGATVPLLGTFTWEKKGDLFRPIFLLSDSFLKAHKVKRKKSHKVPETAPAEDINYSKIAIKFSDSMTKDMIFCGVRDIVKKIGDYFDFGYEADIEFSVGTMMLREKRIKFEFNLNRLKKILPENAFAQAARAEAASISEESSVAPTLNPSSSESLTFVDNDMMSTCSSTTDISSSTFNSSLSNNLSKPPIRALPKLDISKLSDKDKSVAKIELPIRPQTSNSPRKINNARPNTAAVHSNTTRTASAPAESPNLSTSTQRDENVDGSSHNDFSSGGGQIDDNFFTRTNGGRPISPGLERVVKDMEEPKGKSTTADKLEQRRKAQLKVAQDAFLRNFNALKKQAKEEDEIKLQQYLAEKAKKEHDAAFVDNGQSLRKSLQETLDDQIKAFERMKKKEKEEFRNSIINLPVGVGQGHTALKQLSKQELNRELNKQMQRNQQRKEEAKINDMLESKEYLEQIALENDLKFAVDRAKHLEKQRSLLEAWERDGHIKNMKKLTEVGSTELNNYLESTNLYNIVANSEI